MVTRRHISPLPSVSTHKIADPIRTRKLLLHRKELARLIGAVDRKGYTLVPLSMYWKKGMAKLEIGLPKENRNKINARALKKEIGNAISNECLNKDKFKQNKLVQKD